MTIKNPHNKTKNILTAGWAEDSGWEKKNSAKNGLY